MKESSRCSPSYLPRYELNSITTLLQLRWLWHLITHEA